jgi:hypothetical protein
MEQRNYQILNLCVLVTVGCHMSKIAKERENGQFLKLNDTGSSFNEKAQEIMTIVYLLICICREIRTNTHG